MNTQYELNGALYRAVVNHRFGEIEELLNCGADPLGTDNAADPNKHILGEIFLEATNDFLLAAELPHMVEQFYAHGMDISSGKISPYDSNNIHPLWCLAFCQGEYGLNILKTMLEHGLDAVSAEILVDHIFTDIEMCDGCNVADARFMERTSYALKMVMLTASYPQLIEISDYLCKCIELEHNRPEYLPCFQNWNDYKYCIDLSTCTNIPFGLCDATLTILDEVTDSVVWTMLL